MDVGARLTKFREAKGISKNKLAKESNVTQGFISQIELGNRLPTLDVLYRICNVLGIELYEFFAPSDGKESELLSPEIRQIIEKAKKLSPRQLKILDSVLDEWKIEEYSQPEEINRSKQCTQEDDIDLYNIVLVAEAEGREEMRALSPELQAIVKDAIKVSRQRRKEEKKGK